MNIDFMQRLARALPVLGVRVGGMALQIGMNVMIARWLGVESMGLYTLYVTWLVLLADLVSFGVPTFLLRAVATFQAQQQEAAIAPFVQRVQRLTLALAAGVLAPWVFAADALAPWLADDPALAPALRLAALGAWLFLARRLHVESLKGLHHTGRALAIENLSLPMCVMLMLPFLVDLPAQALLQAHLLAIGFTLLLGHHMWRETMREMPARGANAESPAMPWRALWPLWGGTLLNVLYVSMPVLLMPHFVDLNAMGLFGVAFRLSSLATIVLVTLAALYAPRFAAAHAKGDTTELRRQLRQSQLLALGLCSPLLGLCLLAPHTLLALFGDKFTAAAQLLQALALGQLVNAATGLVGVLLNMMHRERSEFLTLLVVAGLMFPAMLLAGHWGGVLAMTLVYSGALMLKNLLSLGLALYFLRQGAPQS